MKSLAYRLCNTLIEAGRYTREDMFNKLDVYLAVNRMTAEEYQDLVSKMDG